MKHLTLCLSLAFLISEPVSLIAQTGEQAAPVIRIKAVERTVTTVTYRPKSGSTRVDFKGTPMLPNAKGKAEVESKQGSVVIKAELEKLGPATQFGPAYLTYVLWAITPEGRPTNLGELVLEGDKSKAEVTTRLQSFGLIVTAEPYFAVTFPSEVVVLENVVRQDTKGKVDEVSAKTELLQRGEYDNAKLEALQIDPKLPPELYQARNAIRIAESQRAKQYAAESLAKAQQSLAQADDYVKRKQPKKSIAMVSREAVQMAEDARIITLKRIEEERLANERQAGADREAKAKAEVEAAEARKKAEEAARQEADRKRREAERKTIEAELATAREAQAKAEAEAARTAAQAKEQQALGEAQRSREAAEKAEMEKQALRARLLEQFNRILETRDTPRGLVVTMTDVLFDTGKYDLRSPAREGLAKLSGIVLAHPGLHLEIEGHTDSTGSDELNQRLSEQRAEGVREYLIEQGLNRDALAARGFGKTMPIASNQTTEGRQKNRRVEIIVSGEVIGTKIGTH